MRSRHFLSRERRTAPLVTLGAVLVLTLGCDHREPERRSGTKPSSTLAPAAAPAAKVAPATETVTRGWSVDKRYSYRLKLTTTLGMGDGPKSFDFDITGNA